MIPQYLPDPVGVAVAMVARSPCLADRLADRLGDARTGRPPAKNGGWHPHRGGMAIRIYRRRGGEVVFTATTRIDKRMCVFVGAVIVQGSGQHRPAR